MTLILELGAEIEAKLRQQAAAVGKDPVGFALDALQEKLSPANGSTPTEASPEEWVAEWRAWAEAHRRLPFEVDDSRESIYAGRGE